MRRRRAQAGMLQGDLQEEEALGPWHLLVKDDPCLQLLVPGFCGAAGLIIGILSDGRALAVS